MRKHLLHVLIISFVLSNLMFGCVTLNIDRDTLNVSPYAKKAKQEIPTTVILKGKKVGYLDFLPLPVDYPRNYTVSERVFTKEIFTRDPSISIPALVRKKYLFVPNDYLAILESSFTQTMTAEGMNIYKYKSLQDADSDGCDFVIWGAPLEFHAVKGSTAIVSVYYKIYQSPGEKVIWDGSIESKLEKSFLPKSINKEDVIFTIGNHGFNFQPQRSLLAFATYRNTMKFLNELEHPKEKK